MSATTNPLQDAAFMKAFLDTFIPASADGVMPAAGELGMAEAVAAAIEADATLGPMVAAGLAAIAEASRAVSADGFVALSPAERAATVKSVASGQPMLVNVVARFVYLAYYQHPRVLEAIGEPARPPFPEGFEVEPTDPALMAILESRRA